MEGVRDHGHGAVARRPLLFVLLSGVVFFGWGEIFSLFPSTLTDTFGTKHATTNYGFLYMAQGVGSVLGGAARRAVARQDRQLAAGVRHHHRDGCADRDARVVRAQADAEKLRGG